MNKHDLRVIKDIFTELSAQQFIKMIYISGSSARKTNVAGSDIDINIVYDNILYRNVNYEALESAANGIGDTAKKYGLNLHIQPPKSLSHFWELIRSGEPWILTEIDSAIPIHDKSDFIVSLKALLKRSQLYKKNERSSILIDRAKIGFLQVQNVFYSETINVLADTIISNLQAILMYFDKFVPYEELPKELKCLVKKDLIKEKEYEFFVTMLKLFKMDVSKRKRYMASHKINVDTLIHSSIEFLERTEYLFELLEYLQKKEQVNLVYDETLKLMKEFINKPLDREIKEDKVIIVFETEIQKKRYVPKEYLKIIKEIMDMKHKIDQQCFSQLSSQQIYKSNATIKNLKELIKAEKYGTKKHA